MEQVKTAVEDEIYQIFKAKVQGRSEPTDLAEGGDGALGHWLERQFGVKANANNQPDFKGYELKKETRDRTTFGDWSADRYIFSSSVDKCSREDFFKIFGSPNSEGRYSWSGSCVPKVGGYNQFGQLLHVSGGGNVFALYNFVHDRRPDKANIVPEYFRTGNLTLAYWSAEKLRRNLEDKFFKLGWFSVRKDQAGVFRWLVFGDPIHFGWWIDKVRAGEIYLDSGMYDGNNRPYQNWRADNTLWESLIVRTLS